MDRQGARRLVLSLFFLCLIVVVADEIVVQKEMPRPYRFVSLTVAFGFLSIMAEALSGWAAGLALVETASIVINNADLFTKLPTFHGAPGPTPKGSPTRRPPPKKKGAKR